MAMARRIDRRYLYLSINGSRWGMKMEDRRQFMRDFPYGLRFIEYEPHWPGEFSVRLDMLRPFKGGCNG